MKIKITDVLPIVNPPEVGSVHTVTRRETEPPRNRRTKMYYIEVGKRIPKTKDRVINIYWNF